MSNKTSQEKIKAFVERWTGKGYEKGESQVFWIELLTDVLDVETPSEIISFEDQVKLDHTSFIDAYIKTTHVMIEQKSIDKDLKAPIKQSDGTLLTPFQQAKRYASELPYSKRPRWIVTCNFKSFLIYDMEQPQGEPFEILLENLPKEAHMLKFLVVDKSALLKHEMEVSIQAGDIVGRLYDVFLQQYQGETTQNDLHALNVLCVRLVFCLYAEDAGVFAKDQFVEYLQSFRPENMRMALIDLFRVLDTPQEARSRFLEDKLKAFPYVNGSLFHQQPGEDIPPITEQAADLLIHHASLDFDWSDISPTIFGAVFESTLNPETRRAGGMHYTSIENIHKVIDPLFMDDLNEQFSAISSLPKGKQRKQKLEEFQTHLSELTFLDPACGSGNFLTETYISLRRLENKVISQLLGGQTMMGFEEISPIKVHIHQFYGIEINDFAATVAKTALWIAEAQMMNETERIIKFNNDYLPLKSYNNITEGNALRVNWEDVVPKEKLSYIIGNPPFVGNNIMTASQREDIAPFFSKNKTIDYVASWYIKAARLIQETNIRCALVSTNSITQGEQVPILWEQLINDLNVHIDFAYRTFRWDSESSQKAHVHCVIIGFSYVQNTKQKKIFNGEVISYVENINPYIVGGPNVMISSRSKPICDVIPIRKGNQPTDGGNLIIEATDYDEFVRQEPKAQKYIKKLIGAKEYINNLDRYCLWLKGVSPGEVRSMPHVLERVKKVREMRLASSDSSTRKLADTPTLFRETNNPETYIIIPSVSSENRRYVPLGFLDAKTIPTNLVLIIPNATLYHFGILESNVHMAWMRAVCGRLKSDYRYSKDIVYNNFPWPSPTPEQQAKIEQTAQAILDARALYPDSSLADLYDPVLMPPELLKAHRENDKAVMQAYGFPIKDFTESDCVAELFKMYKAITESEKLGNNFQK